MAKPEATEPTLSLAAFSQRCNRLAIQFGAAIEIPSGEIAFALEVTNTEAVMTLAGRATEMIARNRGRSHRVAPLAPLGDDVLIWTGYRESWLKQGSEQNFRFVEAGFTLHIGRTGELSKPQILRSEWVGHRSRAFIDTAGHPHWQLDVLESARTSAAASPARFVASAELQTLQEFRGADPMEAPSLLLNLTVENMHLASAALWWRPSGYHVAHAPESVVELDRWVLGCVTYLRQEAGRCKIVTSSF